ncbi:MAG: amidohydrolase [Thermoleophilia bacterium]|nr:amidohydrolase [Thermoleophilia bacterium]
MKKIDFETHFGTREWVDALTNNPGYPRLERSPEGSLRLCYRADAQEPFPDALIEKLLDIGEGRIAAMDSFGIDVAVLSLVAPGAEHFEPALGTEVARQANDSLAEAMGRHPGRFRGYAALAPRDPEAAAKELERAVKHLGMQGWKTHCNYVDSYLDEKRYRPILAKAEELGVPIYLHPTVPRIAEFCTYGIALSGPPFGFGVETALVAMRLIMSGAFDEFPDLKVVLGHYGEGLPFLLHRMDWLHDRPHAKADKGALVQLAKKPSRYLRENFMVSTSGNYLEAAFRCTRDALGMERILLGTDYPFDNPNECLAFLEGLGLSDEEQSALYERNAARLGILA